MLYFLFQFLSFQHAWHQTDGRDRAVPDLKNDSSGDFQHSKQFKFEEKYLCKHKKIHKGKQPSFLAIVNSRCFFLFQAAMLVPLGGTPTWRLHTKLYKFMWNILSNNSSTEYCTDLTPGRIDVERWNKRFATVRSSCDVWCGVGLARALFPRFWFV